MDLIRKLALESCREDIIKDLSVDDVTHELKSRNILSNQEIQVITSSSSPVGVLLEILPKQPNWFDVFLSALVEYPWLQEALINALSLDKHREKILYGVGNVPSLPPCNVSRVRALSEVRRKLKALEKHRYLVIRGMSGCGKSCLVAEALHDVEMLFNTFDARVYWLTVGELERDGPEAEERQCNHLLERLCGMIEPSAHPEQDPASLLRRYFANLNALLVLDDVSSSKVIETFHRIRCKILVTTKDGDTLQHVHNYCEYYDLSGGFTEEESLQFFKKSIEVDNFPPHVQQSAQKIHRACKGMPMVIVLIAGHLADYKEDAQVSSGRWEECEHQLSGCDDAKTVRRSLFEQNMYRTIELTLKNLHSDLRKRYEMFAVFVEDTNITTGALQTLWGADRKEVEEVMNNLRSRCLVVRKYRKGPKDYVYGIHDLLLGYLKTTLSPDVRKEVHCDLLLKYVSVCGDDFSQLPDDNYIFSYICHHVDDADMWETYRSQFFSLGYIGAKLRATGPGDLLLDLFKYERQLKGDKPWPVNDIVSFVQRHGWNIYKQGTDVIQCGLLEPEDSLIYKQASLYVSEEQYLELYFTSLSKLGEKCPVELPFPDVSAACFTIPSNQSTSCRILLTQGSGNIKEVDMHYRKVRREFSAGGNVNLLSLSPSQDRFISASEDGIVQVWRLSQGSSGAANTPPPSMRQRDWVDVHGGDSHPAEILSAETQWNHSSKITCAQFSSDGNRVISASQDGVVKVWSLKGSASKPLEIPMIVPSPYALACTFTADDTIVVFGCGDRKLFFYSAVMNEVPQLLYSSQVKREEGQITSILTVNGKLRKIFIVTHFTVQEWSWEDRFLDRQSLMQNKKKEVLDGMSSKCLPKPGDLHVKLNCAASSDRYLVVGTVGGGCILWDLQYPETPKIIDSGVIDCVDLFGDRVLSVTKSTVKLFRVGEMYSSPRKPAVCSHLGWNNNVVIHAVVLSGGHIEVFHDGRLTYDGFVDGTCAVQVSMNNISHREEIIVATRTGDIWSIDPITRHRKQLPFHLQGKVTHFRFHTIGQTPVCIAASYPTRDSQGDIWVCKLNMSEPMVAEISSPLVEAFICGFGCWLLCIFVDGSVKACPLNQGFKDISWVHLLSNLTKITLASLSSDEKVLVLVGENMTYHVVSILWPKLNSATNGNNYPFISMIKPYQKQARERPNRLKLTVSNGLNGNERILSNGHNGNKGNAQLHEESVGVDDVDGSLYCRAQNTYPKIKEEVRSYPLRDHCLSCAITDNGNFIAFGLAQQGVLVWNQVKKMELVTLPMGGTKVCHVMFSPKHVELSNRHFKQVLLAVSDHMSWWDLSPFVDHDPNMGSHEIKRLASVMLKDSQPDKVTVSPDFNTFAAVDCSGYLTILQAWSKNRRA